MINLYGNGLIGRVDVHYDSTWVEDDEEGGYYSVSRRDERFFYFKDHLGSIRMTIDSSSNIVSAQDYYPYGEILRQNTLGSGVNDKYKFTEKERDTETSYDYFGARYYDSELGRWLQVDPLADKYPGWSPYNYTLNNPLRFIDPDGMSPDVYIHGDDNKRLAEELNKQSSLNIKIDANGKLSAEGDAKTKADKTLLNAINDPDIVVNLYSINFNSLPIVSTQDNPLIVVGAYDGNFVNNGQTIATQFLNTKHAEVWAKVGGGSVGKSVMHEVLEAYIGAVKYPGGYSSDNFNKAHSDVLYLIPDVPIIAGPMRGRPPNEIYLQNIVTKATELLFK